MTNTDHTQTDRLLREAGANPAPRPAFRPYNGYYMVGNQQDGWKQGPAWHGAALFVNGRLRAWYRPDLQNEGLYEVYQETAPHRHEVVEGEDNAQALCYEWLEEQR